MHDLKSDYTLVIVTHNMQQAARVADMTAFFGLEVTPEGSRHGVLVEYDDTRENLHQPLRQTDGGLRHGAVRMRELYGNELEELENLLLEEGRLVDRAIRSALNALARDDLELADELIAFDDEVDRRYLAIEQGIPVLLARQTPVAGDLRLVLAILYINLHLERIADYCVTIAKLTKLSHDLPRDSAVLEALEEMGERCREMLATGLDDFHARDVRYPQALVDMDKPIDRANRKLIDRFVAFGEDEPQREWAMRMMLVSRCLERIGDHTVDIGEQTSYLVRGEFEEFTDASHPTSRPAV